MGKRHSVSAGRPQWDDVFTGWRKYLSWRKGEISLSKRRDAKRRRVAAREEIRRAATHDD